jgi:hypothetical protein
MEKKGIGKGKEINHNNESQGTDTGKDLVAL